MLAALLWLGMGMQRAPMPMDRTLADAPIQQAAVWMVCVLCVVLFAFSLRRRTKRPWR